MGINGCCYYLKYIIKHKWYVFVECCRLGIPWLGIIHDWSRFTPREFIAHMHHFHNPDGSLRSDLDDSDERWHLGWLFHQRRNKHHWQWWVSWGKTGGARIVEMPDKYRREMLADWSGAAIVQGRNLKSWYKEYRDTIQLHPLTRKWIESQMAEMG